jgi:hypothetical protein
MNKKDYSSGNWIVRKTVDDSGDYPFPTYDILAIHEYGPEGIGSADQNPYNALLFATSKNMFELLMEIEALYEEDKDMKVPIEAIRKVFKQMWE